MSPPALLANLILIGLALIVARLAGVIDWSWWLVLAPIWVPVFAVCVAFVTLALFLLR